MALPGGLVDEHVEERAVTVGEIVEQALGEQLVDAVELDDEPAVLFHREGVEPHLRGLADGEHLRPEQLQRGAVDVAAHMTDRAVERERHPGAGHAADVGGPAPA